MFKKQFASALVLLFLGVLAGCGGGGGSTPKFAPPATGSFSNSSLNGAYAFSVSGTNTGGFFGIAGSLTADGNGNITSGLEDINSAGSVLTNVPISGTYSIAPDGRGTAVLNGSVGSFTIDFVLVNGSHGLVIRFDSTATGSGTLDRQDTTAFSTAAIKGPFAFNLSGIDTSSASMQMAGTFTADGVATLTTGVHDVNDNGTVTTNAPAAGYYAVGSNGRGTLVLNSASGTLSFALYVVDANHLKMVETDTVPVLTGEAFRQPDSMSNASLSGSYAFTVAGGLTAPFAAGGLFSADGNGGLANVSEDINNSGTVSQNVAATGSYSIGPNGRGTLALTNSSGTVNFAIYPSSGGLQMMELDSTMLSSGSALQQSGTFSNSTLQGGYGFNVTGVNGSGPFDSIMQFASDGNGKFTGSADFNFAGALSQSYALTGSYTLGANGRGTATLTSSAGTQNFIIYAVSGSNVLVIETDNNSVGLGSFEQQ